jgi:hypothetical protein
VRLTGERINSYIIMDIACTKVLILHWEYNKCVSIDGKPPHFANYENKKGENVALKINYLTVYCV